MERMRSTPHPTLSPNEAERAIENAPKGAADFFVHGLPVYATSQGLKRANVGCEPHRQPRRAGDCAPYLT